MNTNNIPGWRHIANEWADMATNGVQWLRNIRDGASTPIEALEEMEANCKRIQALQRPAPSPAGAPAAEAEECFHLIRVKTKRNLERWSVVDKARADYLMREYPGRYDRRDTYTRPASPEPEHVKAEAIPLTVDHIEDITSFCRIAFGSGAAAYNDGVDAFASELKRRMKFPATQPRPSDADVRDAVMTAAESLLKAREFCDVREGNDWRHVGGCIHRVLQDLRSALSTTLPAAQEDAS